jgi:hypothetical protein
MLGDLYFRAIVDHFAKLMNNESATKLEKVENGVDANWSSEDFTEYADLSRVSFLSLLLSSYTRTCRHLLRHSLGPLQCWPAAFRTYWSFNDCAYSLVPLSLQFFSFGHRSGVASARAPVLRFLLFAARL